MNTKKVAIIVFFLLTYISPLDFKYTEIPDDKVPEHHSIHKFKSYHFHLKGCNKARREQLVKEMHPVHKQFGKDHKKNMKEKHKQAHDFDYFSVWLIPETYDKIINEFQDCILICGEEENLSYFDNEV